MVQTCRTAWKTARSSPKSRKRCCAKATVKTMYEKYLATTHCACWNRRRKQAGNFNIRNKPRATGKTVRASGANGNVKAPLAETGGSSKVWSVGPMVWVNGDAGCGIRTNVQGTPAILNG